MWELFHKVIVRRKLMKKEIPTNHYYPWISEETMYLHYEKLYKKYLQNLQNLIGEQSAIEAIQHISEYPLEKRGNILYQAGGVLNHELYFEEINQNGKHIPEGTLKQAIDQKYGSYEKFKQEFIKNTKLLVGSGYTFLVLNSKNELDIVNMSNQETPYLYDMTPIMNIDLWEHAYYLDYKTDKEKYVTMFFDLLDFDVIESRYEKIVNYS